jgi:uncharacterized phosphosugar-binding protein
MPGPAGAELEAGGLHVLTAAVLPHPAAMQVGDLRQRVLEQHDMIAKSMYKQEQLQKQLVDVLALLQEKAVGS